MSAAVSESWLLYFCRVLIFCLPRHERQIVFIAYSVCHNNFACATVDCSLIRCLFQVFLWCIDACVTGLFWNEGQFNGKLTFVLRTQMSVTSSVTKEKKINKLTNFKGTYNKADVSLDLLVAESSGENQFLYTG